MVNLLGLRLRVHGENTPFEGVSDKVGLSVQGELAHHIRPVGLCCARAYKKLNRDFSVVETFR